VAEPAGGNLAALLSSLVATWKRHRVDPAAYRRDVFTRIGVHPQQDRLEELPPDNRLAAQTGTTD